MKFTNYLEESCALHFDKLFIIECFMKKCVQRNIMKIVRRVLATTGMNGLRDKNTVI